MLHSLRIFIIWSLKFGAPILLILFTSLMIYGSLNVDPQSAEILSEHEYTIAIQTEFRSSSINNHKVVSRSYLLINDDPFSSTTIRITNHSDGTLEIEKSDGGLLLVVIGYLSLILAIWWFWIREETHNKALQADAAKPRR